MKKIPSIIVSGLALVALGTQAGTLDDVKQRDSLICGVSTGLAGFSQKDEKGVWSGLDVDVCRGVAAAVLGDAGKVRY
ncbi:MAG: general L-amino acid transport system substrate-binding protein, partial [Candidatus Endobugula sp.]